MAEKAVVRLTVDNVFPEPDGLVHQKKVHMRAIFDPGVAQDAEAISTTTPWAELLFGINNPALADFFTPGDEFYLELRKA